MNNEKIYYAIINDSEGYDGYGTIITITDDLSKAKRIQDFFFKERHIYTDIQEFVDGFIANQYAWLIRKWNWDNDFSEYVIMNPDITQLNKVTENAYGYEVLVQAYSKDSAIAIGKDLIEVYRRNH